MPDFAFVVRFQSELNAEVVSGSACRKFLPGNGPESIVTASRSRLSIGML
jgi:hypothetical protein